MCALKCKLLHLTSRKTFTRVCKNFRDTRSSDAKEHRGGIDETRVELSTQNILLGGVQASSRTDCVRKSRLFSRKATPTSHFVSTSLSFRQHLDFSLHLHQRPLSTLDTIPPQSNFADMAPFPKRKLRPTVMELYLDREKIRWYWRALGIAASSLILAGYIYKIMASRLSGRLTVLDLSSSPIPFTKAQAQEETKASPQS